MRHRTGTGVANSFDPLGPIKDREFLEKLGDYLLLKDLLHGISYVNCPLSKH
jgi:hypothetical protein